MTKFEQLEKLHGILFKSGQVCNKIILSKKSHLELSEELRPKLKITQPEDISNDQMITAVVTAFGMIKISSDTLGIDLKDNY